MKINELFEFYFVDRERERKIFNKFILNNDEANLLWIQGERGVGKTRLIKHIIENHKRWISIIINSAIEDTEMNVILSFLEEIQKYHDITLLDYVKKYYDSFYKIGKPISSGITTIKIPGLQKLIEYIFDGTYAIINKLSKSQEPYKLICEYIDEILKRHKLIITFDNFTRCDKKSSEILLSVIRQFVEKKEIRFCLVTTSEDMEKIPYFEEDLLSSVPVKPMKIGTLDRHELFYQILNQKFLLDSLSGDDIIYIHNKCDGNPQKLVKILQKLLLQDGISGYITGKAKLDYGKLINLLKLERFQLEKDDFPIKERWILFTMISFGKKMNFSLLEKVASYLSENIVYLKILKQQDFYDTLYKLVEQKILALDSSENVLFVHDEYFYDISELFETELSHVLYYDGLYKYINSSLHDLLKFGYSKTDIIGLMCLYAYKAKKIGWQEKNYSYGAFLCKKHFYEEATIIFERFNENILDISDIAKIRIVICFYEVGKYQIAKKWQELIDIDKIKRTLLKYLYFYYSAKICNNLNNNKIKAIRLLEKTLEYTDDDSSKKVNVLNLLHLYHLETENGYQTARKIFYLIKNDYKQICPIEWANTMRGCQNFISGQDAIELLNSASDLLIDNIEKAYITNSKGFIYMKMDDYKRAEEEFDISYSVLKELKIHEASYAANNLAVMLMIRNHYEEALEILYNALLWCSTNYAKLVIRIHLMVCHSYLGHINEAENLIQFFEDYLNTNKVIDAVIARKILINLSVCCKLLHKIMQSTKILEKAVEWAKGTNSEYRLFLLLNRETDLRPKNKYEKFTGFEPWFLIYAHD